ncbi:hypothetical protein ACSZMM_21820 [Aeromonas caviae]|uniref:hypothetical protein n=1 Tax=Aeromonas caviae TaxID=648 RepID=UPI003EC898A3
MTTIGLSYSLVKISTKCAPALWWTKIIIGLLLFSFIALQRLLILVSEHRKANKPGPFKRQVAAQPE